MTKHMLLTLANWALLRSSGLMVVLLASLPTIAELPTRFCVVPPGPVASGSRVEARISLENTGDTPVVAELDFTYRHGDARMGLGRQTVTLRPGAKTLASAWHTLEAAIGAGVMSCTVIEDSGSATVSWPIEVIPVSGTSLPYLQGMWVEPIAVIQQSNTADPETLRSVVRYSLRSMHAVGVRVVILAYVEYLGQFFYPSTIEFQDHDVQRPSKGADCTFDMVEAFLREADMLGMHVFLGLGRSGDTHLLWEFDAPDWNERLKLSIDTASQVANELWQRYGGHKSLYGWYLSHEMNDLARAAAYYDPVARYCHALAPDMPVLIAPAGTPVLTSGSLAASEVDIVAWQDAVGAGYVPYEYTYAPERRIAMLEEIFSRYAALHAGSRKHFWADLEIWEMDGTAGYSGAYPAPFARLMRQIQIEGRYAGLLTGYAWHGYMQSPLNTLERPNERARVLYSAYATYQADVTRPGH